MAAPFPSAVPAGVGGRQRQDPNPDPEGSYVPSYAGSPGGVRGRTATSSASHVHRQLWPWCARSPSTQERRPPLPRRLTWITLPSSPASLAKNTSGSFSIFPSQSIMTVSRSVHAGLAAWQGGREGISHPAAGGPWGRTGARFLSSVTRLYRFHKRLTHFQKALPGWALPAGSSREKWQQRRVPRSAHCSRTLQAGGSEARLMATLGLCGAGS